MKINTLRMILFAVILSIISVNSVRKFKDDCAKFQDTGMTEKQFNAIKRAKEALAAYKVYQETDSKEWFEGELLKYSVPIKENFKNQDKVEKEAEELKAKRQSVNLDLYLEGNKDEVAKQKANDEIDKRNVEIGDLRIKYVEFANKTASEMTNAFDKRWEKRMAEFEKTKTIVFAAIDEAMSSCVKAPGIKIKDVAANLKALADKKEVKFQPTPKSLRRKF